ncbi:hypothetical protein [Halomarina ordinaria]|uniref:HhH-GPD domain-containing protein n=1 Tax=Halomarina ordinaria TaxID=3033939 RepID=A0ABD5U469_9EURY|nr:hypothetical protein [Halomarina sp. PSRA2]
MIRLNFINGSGPDCGNIPSLVKEYKNLRPNEKVHYIHNGNTTDDQYEFRSISNHLQQQGHVTIFEYGNIMKIRSNISDNFDSNAGPMIKKHTHDAISSHPNTRRQLRELCKLRGVGVSRASMLLATIFPNDYSMVDLPRIRAFINWYIPQVSSYSKYANLITLFQTYDTINGYIEYTEVINQLSQSLGIPHREIGMALWAYDQLQI